MNKLNRDDAEALSANLLADNRSRLKALFPEAIVDGELRIDVLKQLVGDTVEAHGERYGLSWHGKRDARRLSLMPSSGTLRPDRDGSVNWDTTANLMIEGDNLEVLKLLQKSYSGRVQLIYIDPPYNTGKDFVYRDSFHDSIRHYEEVTGQREGGTTITTNPESGGRFHTEWLNMLYPRLRLARQLLSADGAIFLTLDDREHAHARLLLDEIFGEENFVANVVWQKKYAVANDDPGIGAMHDNILVYQRSASFQRGLLPRTAAQNDRYANPDNDPRGPWASDNYVSNKSKDERPTLWYPIRHPASGEDVWPDEHAVWRYSQEKHQALEQEGRLYWGPNLSYKKPRLKRYLGEVQQGIVPPTWWPFDECGHNDEAQKETAALLGQKVFSTPKPLRLIDRMLTIGARSDALVMDFFAGSGTTGHAVLAKNASDGGTRRYILVQLPEPLDPSNADQRSASAYCDSIGRPRTLSELTKERLRRAGQVVAAENPMFSGDLGFRAFKLSASNIEAWAPDRENLADALARAVIHLRADRTEDDILFELLLKLGLDLCTPIETRPIAGKQVHSVGAGTLLACLDEAIGAADIEALALGIAHWHAALAPSGDATCVFRDNAFPNDVAKTNMAAILRQHGLQTVRSL